MQSAKETYLEELFELLRIPSISALTENKSDVMEAADWVANYAGQLGFKTEMLYAEGTSEQDNHPVVYAERIDDHANPTVLIYGHYDVQPVDPIDQWKSDPFEPIVKGGNIYARGSTDDKGQMFTHLAALKHLSEEWGETWPLNVKLAIEGQEEMGGENIEALLSEMPDKFAADVAVVSDTGFIAEDKPTLEYGLKGIAYMQIDVRLADADMHSGLYGGGVMNPANALTQILAQLQDPTTGKVLIPGFYDDVVDIDDQERVNLAKIPFDKESFLAEAAGAYDTWSEEGYTTIEHTAARPTLDINGIWAGFQGEGAKTIIPADAHAKVSMRLVANQDPKKIGELFGDFVHSIAPEQVVVSTQFIHAGDGVLIDVNSEYMRKAQAALERTFGGEVIFSRSGGSIPVVAQIYKQLEMDVILMGYGLPDDGLHSPNEKMGLQQFYKGIDCNIEFYKSLITS